MAVPNSESDSGSGGTSQDDSTAATTTTDVENSDQNEIQKWKVILRVYDISNGMARTMSPMLLGKQIEGIWHTGLLVYNLEYFYGGGILSGTPEEIETSYNMKSHRVIELGETEIPQNIFHSYLEDINSQFTMETYDLVNWNCNNFSDEAAKFLLGHGIPSYIVDLPKEALSTPMGRMILPMLQASQKATQAQMAKAGEASLWTPGANANFVSPSAVTASSEEAISCSDSSNRSGSSATTIVSDGDRSSANVGDKSCGSGTNSSPVTTATSPVSNPTTMKEALELLRSSESSERLAKQFALNTLKMIAWNILQNPQEKKFRVLKKSNAALQRKVLALRGGPECLKVLGFEEGRSEKTEGGKGEEEEEEEVWIYNHELSEEALEKLKGQKAEIEEALKKLEMKVVEKDVVGKGEMRKAESADGGGGVGSGGGGASNDMTRMMEMMARNPQMAARMQQHPLAQQMAASNPMVSQMMNDPAMMQQALQMMQSNPAIMQQTMRMMGQQPSNMTGGGMSSTFDNTSTSSNRFRSELNALASMGFTNEQENIAALSATNGDVSAAIERLLNSQSS